jgi:hypothetical protein
MCIQTRPKIEHNLQAHQELLPSTVTSKKKFGQVLELAKKRYGAMEAIVTKMECVKEGQVSM